MNSNSIRVNMPLRDLSAERLNFYRQIGVEEATMPSHYSAEFKEGPVRPLVPAAHRTPPGPQPSPWNEDELRRIKERIESFGLSPTVMALPVSGNIIMGKAGRDSDIASVKENIHLAGRLGLRALTYNFTALRASEGYAARPGGGRGGSDLRDFDYERIRDLPPLENVGRHGYAEMWERLECFLQAVVPAAEAAGVRLAAHPNDPPVPEYRGVAQPLGDLDAHKRLIEIVDSPANCVFFDTGVTTEWGEDAVETIRYFGSRDRIGTVHFRNVRVEVPRYKYLETFIDEGDCDMAACMRAFAEVGYSGGIDPDHTPGIGGDTTDTRMGWAFAVGHILALRSTL